MTTPGHDTTWDHPGRCRCTQDQKPHHGVISNWTTRMYGNIYRIAGIHDGDVILTSAVCKHDFVTGEIETKNSRYKLDCPGFQ